MLFTSDWESTQEARVTLWSQPCHVLDYACIQMRGLVHELNSDGEKWDFTNFDSDDRSLLNTIKLKAGWSTKLQTKLNNGRSNTAIVSVTVTKRKLTLTTATPVPDESTVTKRKLTSTTYYGTYTYASGNKYVGQMKDGKMHGNGIFTWVSGTKYVGQMKDGKMHGQGTKTLADGTIEHSGEWVNDKPKKEGETKNVS